MTLYVTSADAPEGIKGLNASFGVLEEFTLLPAALPGKTESLWSVIISRLRVKGGTQTVDASGTPEGVSNWSNQPGMFGRAPTDVDRIQAWTRDFRVVRGTSWDNRANLAEGSIEAMVDSMDPTQVQEKIYGIPSAGVGGAAYKYFDVAKNIRLVNYVKDRGPVIVAVDYNYNPFCAVLLQYWRGVFFVFDEIRLSFADTHQMSRAIIEKLRVLGCSPQDALIFPDASGRAKRTVGDSDHDIMRSYGLSRLRYDPAGNPPVKDRLNAVNGACFHGRLVIDPRCKGLIKDMSLVAVNDAGEIIKTNQDISHLSDGLGYAVVGLHPVRGPVALGVVRVGH